ncbi:hypothetical protein [Streptomyces zaomyceticus]|uniref:hypothetical protein n=1 Tax=Streptomyces zaomyceticus TaxID=68286 RepID=UPI0037872934
MAEPVVARQIAPLHQAVPAASSHAVVVLPREFDDGGVAWYQDSALDLVKALKYEGLDASFAHASEERRWIGEKSQLQYAIDVAIAIFSAGAYDGIKRLLRRRHADTPVRIRITRRSLNGAWEWYELEGSGEDVAEAIDRLTPGPQNPEISE